MIIPLSRGPERSSWGARAKIKLSCGATVARRQRGHPPTMTSMLFGYSYFVVAIGGGLSIRATCRRPAPLRGPNRHDPSDGPGVARIAPLRGAQS